MVDVRRTLDVRSSDGQVLEGVPSTALRPVVPFRIDEFVIYRGWLARIYDVRPPTSSDYLL